MSLLLVLAVVAPLAGSAAAVLLSDRAADAVRAGAMVSAVCWFVLLVDAAVVSVSRIHSVPLVAAAGCGAALVVAAIDITGVERPAFVGAALVAASLGIAAGRTATDGGGTLLALGVAAAFAVVAGQESPRAWGPAVGGLALAAIGIVALRSGANSWQLPLADAVSSHRGDGVLIVAGAALLVLAGVQRIRGPVALLVPAGAFLAVQAAPIVHRTDGLTWLSIALGLGAVAAAVAARAGRPLLNRPAAALTLLAMAALVAPGSTRGSALLLAAAGTLAAALGWPAAAALGVPGGIALAIALAAHGGAGALVVGILAGAVGVALAAAVLREDRIPRPSIWVGPALGLGAWLVVAPGTWGWAGPVNLRSYDIGAARALAGGVLCLVVLVLMGRDPAGWYARVFPPDSAGEDAVRH